MRAWLITLIFVLQAGQAFAITREQAINKAVTYFRNKKELLSPGAVLTLDFLSRNYALRIDTKTARKALLKENPLRQRPTLRTIDHRYEMSELEVSTMKSVRWIMARAVFCDRYPIPWDYTIKLRELGNERGGYAAPWGIQALAIITWQGCSMDAETVASLRQFLAEKSREIIQREIPGSANWMDFLLSLYLAGKSDWVTNDMLGILVNKQDADGRWEKNDDTTAKALWILLLASDPQGIRRKIESFRKTDL